MTTGKSDRRRRGMRGPAFPDVIACLMVGFLAGLGLGGCTDADDGPPTLEELAEQAAKREHAWQASVLEDGDITLDEYDEGHRRTLACLEAAGLTTSEPERNIPDGFRWNYDVFWDEVGEEDGARAMSECTDAYIGRLELAMTVWGDWETPADVLAAASECVARAGFSVVAQGDNYRELWLAGAEQGLPKGVVGTCVATATTSLYPDASGASVGF